MGSNLPPASSIHISHLSSTQVHRCICLLAGPSVQTIPPCHLPIIYLEIILTSRTIPFESLFLWRLSPAGWLVLQPPCWLCTLFILCAITLCLQTYLPHWTASASRSGDGRNSPYHPWWLVHSEYSVHFQKLMNPMNRSNQRGRHTPSLEGLYVP